MGLDYTVPVAVQLLKSVLNELYDTSLLPGHVQMGLDNTVPFTFQLFKSILHVLCDLSLT
jgi:hypothetical protein